MEGENACEMFIRGAVTKNSPKARRKAYRRALSYVSRPLPKWILRCSSIIDRVQMGKVKMPRKTTAVR